MALPTDSKVRKTYPMFTGLIRYFPDALGSVANLSFETNQRHNPGEPLHWAREKSNDHDDCVARHTTDIATAMNAGDLDMEIEERRQQAWRSLAGLQLALERKQMQQYAGGGNYGNIQVSQGADKPADWVAVKPEVLFGPEKVYPPWANNTPLERQAYDAILREAGVNRNRISWTTLCAAGTCLICDDFRKRARSIPPVEAPVPGPRR